MMENHAPQLTFASMTLGTVEDTPLVAQGSMADADGDAITLSIQASPAHGTLSTTVTDGTVTVTYSPAQNYFGADAFTLQAADAAGGSSGPVAFSVIVTSVADAPVAVADAVTVGEDDGTVTFAMLTANDSDPVEGDSALAIASVTQSMNGAAVAVVVPASVTYVVDAVHNGLGEGETATDSFSYTIQNDGMAQASAVVTVTITGANDAPSFSSLPLTTACQAGAALSIPVNVSDPDATDTPMVAITSESCPGAYTVGPGPSVVGECPALAANCTINLEVTDGIATRPGTLTLLGGNVVYVQAGATGSGAGWGSAGLTGATGNLQGAIDLAIATGRSVWVKADTFTGSFGISAATGALRIYGGFAGTETFASERPAVTFSTLDGGDSGRVLSITGSNVLLDGLDLAHGFLQGDGEAGAGLLVGGSQVGIVRCAIRANELDGGNGIGVAGGSVVGAGAYIDNSTVAIDQSFFIHNFANAGDGQGEGADGGHAFGGAVAINASVVSISGSVFLRNRAEAGGGGAGVVGGTGGNGGTAWGGAVYAEASQLYVESSYFFYNRVLGNEGGNGGDGAPGTPGGAGGPGGHGGEARGGAIHSNDSVLQVYLGTFMNNRVLSGYGGIGGDGGAGVSNGNGGDGGAGGWGGDAFGGSVSSSSLQDVAIEQCVFSSDQTLTGGGAQGGLGGDGAGTGVGGSGGAGGTGGNTGGGSVHADRPFGQSAQGTLLLGSVSILGSNATPGSGGNGGNGGAGTSGGDGGDGGDGGTSAGAGARVVLDGFICWHCTIYDNEANNGGGGSFGSGGAPDGANGSDGNSPNEGSGGLSVPTGSLMLHASVLVGNNGGFPNEALDNLDGDDLFDYNCSDQANLVGASGNAGVADAAIFALSGQVFLNQSDVCVDLVAPAFSTGIGLAWATMTTSDDLSLDVTPPDAGAHYLPRVIRTLTAPASEGNPLVWEQEGAEGCVVVQAEPFLLTTVTGPTGSVVESAAAAEYGALVCQGVGAPFFFP